MQSVGVEDGVSGLQGDEYEADKHGLYRPVIVDGQEQRFRPLTSDSEGNLTFDSFAKVIRREQHRIAVAATSPRAARIEREAQRDARLMDRARGALSYLSNGAAQRAMQRPPRGR